MPLRDRVSLGLVLQDGEKEGGGEGEAKEGNKRGGGGDKDEREGKWRGR